MNKPPPPPGNSNRLIFLGLVLVVLAGVLIWRKMQPTRVGDHATVGTKLTAFSLEPLTGESRHVKLEDLRGKVSLVNFWGPWCHFCRHEFPELIKIQEEFSGREDYEMFLVSCPFKIGGDLNQLQRETRQFMSERGLTLPVFSDPLAKTRKMLEAAGVSKFGYPTTMILDRDGTIQGLWPGYLETNGAEMRVVLRRLLK